MNRYFFNLLFLLCVSIYSHADVWNSPHDSEQVKEEVLFSSFSIPPKRLDPVVSYSSNEWAIITTFAVQLLEASLYVRAVDVNSDANDTLFG